jgi:hypothetical protein
MEESKTIPDPFRPADNGGSTLPRVAKVRWKLKGAKTGPVLKGTTEVIPCATCGQNKVRR